MSEFISILEKIKPGYKAGGIVTIPKRGLVDGPGSYGGERFNQKSLGGEGNQYIKTYNTKGGEKRYIAQYDRRGFNKKKSAPFTPEGLKIVRKARDGFENEFRELKKTDPQRVGDKSIVKLKDPPNSKKPWRYIQTTSIDGKSKRQAVTYYESEAKAKAAQNKVLENRRQKRFVSYKDKLPQIKKLFKKGKTIKQVSKKTRVPLSAIQNELGMIGKKASDYQPQTYLYDEKLKQKLIKDYRKLGRLELAKKLFPNDKLKTADAKFGHLAAKIFEEGRLEPKKSGELSESQRKKRGPKKTTPEADAASKFQRGKKLTKLGSKNYENSLGRFKTEIGRLLGIKEVVGKKSSYMPLDLSHRSDIGC